jgi:predicted HAD superfamily Cof-like phosphohydrolase
MTTTNFLKVQDFNISFGIDRSNTPNDKLIKLRWDLIKEETDELFYAIETKNYIEILDAISDILYVVYGAADSFKNDFDKEIGDKNTINSNVNIIINKLELELSDDIKQMSFGNPRMDIIFNNKNENSKLNKLSQDYIYEIFKLSEFFDNKNISKIITQLVIIHNYMYVFSYLFGFNLDYTFDLVHKSNMSKLAETESVAQQTVKWYLENEKRYDSPDYRISPDLKYWVIYNKNTGKALKSINYHPVDLSILFQ